jgi:hypothetical protein
MNMSSTFNKHKPATNKTLGVKDGVFRVLRRLIFGGLTNQTFIVVREGDPRGSNAVA